MRISFLLFEDSLTVVFESLTIIIFLNSYLNSSYIHYCTLMVGHIVLSKEMGHRDGSKCDPVCMPPLVPCRCSSIWLRQKPASGLFHPLFQGRHNYPEFTLQMKPTCHPWANKGMSYRLIEAKRVKWFQKYRKWYF